MSGFPEVEIVDVDRITLRFSSVRPFEVSITNAHMTRERRDGSIHVQGTGKSARVVIV